MYQYAQYHAVLCNKSCPTVMVCNDTLELTWYEMSYDVNVYVMHLCLHTVNTMTHPQSSC